MFGFQGQEKDDEVKGIGNSLDFGARIYDSRVGRWLALDPLQAKYPSLSPYHAFADNPILFIDPNGKEIFIGGIKYNPPTKRTASDIEQISNSNTFVKETFEALDYIYSNSGKETYKLDALITHKNTLVNIKETKDFGQVNVFIPISEIGGDIIFNPNQAKDYGNGKQSATTALAHELDHAYQNNTLSEKAQRTGNYDELLNFQMPNEAEKKKEENRATKGLETIIAKSKGEFVRIDYSIIPKAIFKAKSVFSTEQSTNVSADEQKQIDATNEKLE